MLPAKPLRSADAAPLPPLPQQLACILVMDLAESVRLMAADEHAVIEQWRGFVRAAAGVLPARGGRLVKSLGDGILATFAQAPDAAETALELQRHFDGVNALLAPDCRFYLRAGLHVGLIFVDEHDIYGRGVNLAARVAGLARPGETRITADVRDRLPAAFQSGIQDLGESHLKHMAAPVRTYQLGPAIAGAARGAAAELPVALRPTVALLPAPRSLEAGTRGWLGETPWRTPSPA